LQLYTDHTIFHVLNWLENMYLCVLVCTNVCAFSTYISLGVILCIRINTLYHIR